MFQNLVGNAIKSRGQEPPCVHVSTSKGQSEWTFTVRDNGTGLPPASHTRVFAILERLHPTSKYPGCGIGLALCKRIVQRHGGRIWVESEEGKGATFCFAVPAS